MQNENEVQKDRWGEIKDIWTENTGLWLIPGLILGCFIGFLVGISSTADLDHWFINGMWPNVLTSIATIGIVDQIVRRRSRQLEKETLRRDLKWQVTSSARDIAVNGIERIKYEGWLEGDTGLLKGINFGTLSPKWHDADLTKVNLQRADLSGGNLQRVKMTSANLDHISLAGANLEGSDIRNSTLRSANLIQANFAKADLIGADMKGAVLFEANLQGANLCVADLQNAALVGVDLTGACLIGANLEGVAWATLHNNRPVILPDGTVHHEGTDLSRFTDPDHEDLWLPVDISWMIPPLPRDLQIDFFKSVARTAIAERKI